MTDPKPPPKPFEYEPRRPKMRVRLTEDGPFIDLGVSHSELLVGILDTLDGISTLFVDVELDSSLRTALDAINVHRGKGKA
jgi:hypothetical protein